MTPPDLTAWSRDETLRDLARIARDLGTPGGEEELIARLARLTEDQRAEVAAAMARRPSTPRGSGR